MAKKVSDDKLLETLLIHGGVVREAASSCGLSQNAIYKRLQNTTFRTQYDMLQGIMLSTVALSLIKSLENAVGVLVKLLDDPETSPGIKVTAANSLLSHANRYIESANILRRLNVLERIAIVDNNEVQ